MKDTLHEQLSALVDAELVEHEQALLLKQLAADAMLRVRLSRYQLISDALQNHLPQHVDPAFFNRVQAALDAEPAVHARGRVIRKLARPAAGMAIAASVAVVAVLTLQSIRQESPNATPALASSAPGAGSGAYIHADIPPPTAPLTQGLDIYLVNHNEYAANRGMQGMLPYVRLVGQENDPEYRK